MSYEIIGRARRNLSGPWRGELHSNVATPRTSTTLGQPDHCCQGNGNTMHQARIPLIRRMYGQCECLQHERGKWARSLQQYCITDGGAENSCIAHWGYMSTRGLGYAPSPANDSTQDVICMSTFMTPVSVTSQVASFRQVGDAADLGALSCAH